MTRVRVLFIALVSATATASAKPAHKLALAEHLGTFLPAKLNHCNTCHVPETPGAPAAAPDEPREHNAFGKRLAAVRATLRKEGKKATIAERIDAIVDEDSDGDGATNLREILLGRNPGDKTDRPAAADFDRADTLRADLQRSRTGYRWTPLEPVKRPAVPVAGAGWIRNPIDAFVAAGHAERGLSARPEAPKAVLLRRAYLDVIGLPPTPEELHAYLADDSPRAFEKVVDRLLQDPRYGQRWGRHFMDVWRYSDWAGWNAQVRDSHPHIWRWRDWIVDSLNADQGYDRMVTNMLAADEVAGDDADATRALGYLVRNYKLLSREKWMQDTVEHTAQAFLGLTLKCARCHDHPYDPVQQVEYYRMRAVFEPHNVRIDRIEGTADTKADGLLRAFDADASAKTYLFVRGDDRYPDKNRVIEPGVPEALGGRWPTPTPVDLPLELVSPDRRAFVDRETLRQMEAAVAKAKTDADAAIAKVLPTAIALVGLDPLRFDGSAREYDSAIAAVQTADLELSLAQSKLAALQAVIRVEKLQGDRKDAKTPDPALDAARKDAMAAQRSAKHFDLAKADVTARAAREKAATALETAIAGKAAPAAIEAARKVKTAADTAATAAEKALAGSRATLNQPATVAYTARVFKEFPKTSTGRRTALARWITDESNPLAARVAVNHVWARRFGAGIVPNAADLGRNGRPPTHPALLDWLAAEFMQSGWSVKHLHRLMLTSATYRMASTVDVACWEKDRDNLHLWRMPQRRLEAEAVRDCVLYVTGRLDPAMGGPDIDHALGLSNTRRSLYFRHAAEKQMEFLKIFDCASVTECYQRNYSVLPQQALALANSDLTLRSSRLLARRFDPALPASGFVTSAFERVLARPPSPAESAECVSFLESQTARWTALKVRPADKADGSAPSPEATTRARENLIHVLLNHHEFVSVR